MATLFELNEKAKKIDIYVMLDEIFSENEKEILEIYQQNQLMYGNDENNETIGLYANISYAEEKNMMNPKAGLDRVDLKYTGAFYNEMVIQQTKYFYQVTSFVPYLSSITKKYGMSWAGFNEKVKTILYEKIIYQQLMNKVRQQLGIV